VEGAALKAPSMFKNRSPQAYLSVFAELPAPAQGDNPGDRRPSMGRGRHFFERQQGLVKLIHNSTAPISICLYQ
jgi:hypothetical protein